MYRRTFLTSLLSCAAAPLVRAEEKPWVARVLKGGFDGKVWWAGLHISLLPKWKTYWRVPGEGGIAPQIDLVGENIAKRDIFHPLPQRYEDEAGMTIGYKQDVVFPIALEPTDATKPVKVSVSAFFGVCDVVCIPAQHATDMVFDPAKADAADQMLISQWKSRVPIFSFEGPIIQTTAEMRDGKPHLVCDLRAVVDDIFVEGNPVHYFGKPSFTRGLADIPVSGAKTLDELKGGLTRITVAAGGRGLEQSVSVV